MGKGKKKGYFNNKAKTAKISPSEVLNITYDPDNTASNIMRNKGKNHTSQFPPFADNNKTQYRPGGVWANTQEKHSLLLRYIAPFCEGSNSWDDNHSSIARKLKNASDEDLDKMIEEYFEYHDTKYGIDYNYNYNYRNKFSYESHALLIMSLAWGDKNYRLMEKLAKRGVTLDKNYNTDDHLYPESYISLALSSKDKTLLEMTVKNGGRIGRGDLVRTFYKENNNIFEYLVDNVRDKSVFANIFEILLEGKIMVDDALIHRRIQLLLDKGADPDENYNGRCMIDVALFRIKAGKISLGQILKAYINTGIGTSYISSIEQYKIHKYFGNAIKLNTLSKIDNMMIEQHTHKLKGSNYHSNYHDDFSNDFSGDYGINNFIIYRFMAIRAIIDMINNTIPQPIAEEITPNIYLL